MSIALAWGILAACSDSAYARCRSGAKAGGFANVDAYLNDQCKAACKEKTGVRAGFCGSVDAYTCTCNDCTCVSGTTFVPSFDVEPA